MDKIIKLENYKFPTGSKVLHEQLYQQLLDEIDELYKAQKKL